MTAKSAYYEIVTLAELGSKLPVGINGDRSLKLREWTAEEQLILAESLDEKTDTQGRYCEVVLATMCEQFGPHVFWDRNGPGGSWRRTMDLEMAILKLREAYAADVLYAYAFLRREALGNIAYMTLRDPDTGDDTRFPADLDTLDVRVPTGDLMWEAKTTKPYTIGDKQVSRFIMGQALWGSMAAARGGDKSLQIIAAAIRSIPDYDKRMNAASSDLLAKMRLGFGDIQRMYKDVNEHTLGPLFMVEGVSKKGKKFAFLIDWNYSHFFGPSSL